MKKIFNIFDTRPLIWLHYVLLTGGLFAAFYIGDKYLDLSNKSFTWMFAFWFISLVVIDQLIHSKYILNVD